METGRALDFGATNSKNLVEIERRNAPRYFISPDDKNLFLSTLGSFIRERELGTVIDA